MSCCKDIRCSLYSNIRFAEALRNWPACEGYQQKLGIGVPTRSQEATAQQWDKVPPPMSIFLLHLVTNFLHASNRDFLTFVKTHDCLATNVDCGHDSKWCSTQRLKQCQATLAAVICDDGATFILCGVCAAFAVDETDSQRMLGLRFVSANYTTVTRDMCHGVVRDHKEDTTTCADATMECLEQRCLLRGKPLDRDSLAPQGGSNLKIDEHVFNHLRSCFVCASTTGAEPEA